MLPNLNNQYYMNNQNYIGVQNYQNNNCNNNCNNNDLQHMVLNTAGNKNISKNLDNFNGISVSKTTTTVSQNSNNNINNKNQEIDYKSRKHIANISKKEPFNCIIEKETDIIDANETNLIKSIVQYVYTNFNKNKENKKLSFILSEKIKRRLGGEWFVFISNINQDIPFNIYPLTEEDYLIIKIEKKCKIKIAKLK